MALSFETTKALTFDCYGTLIDWESGILEAVRPVLQAHGAHVPDGRILETFALLEAEEEAGAYRPYRAVLRNVMARLADAHGCELSPGEADLLPDSVPRWPAFPDTAAALRRLAERFTINVISNVDDDLFEATVPKLGVPVHRFVSAQYCRSYKPAMRNFRVMLALLDLRREQVLHVGQSLYHDIRPARALGLRTVWVRRRATRSGGGATPPAPDALPDIEVPDLATLSAAALRPL